MKRLDTHMYQTSILKWVIKNYTGSFSSEQRKICKSGKFNPFNLWLSVALTSISHVEMDWITRIYSKNCLIYLFIERVAGRSVLCRIYALCLHDLNIYLICKCARLYRLANQIWWWNLWNKKNNTLPDFVRKINYGGYNLILEGIFPKPP